MAVVRDSFEAHGDARLTEFVPQNERATVNRAGFHKPSDGAEQFYLLLRPKGVTCALGGAKPMSTCARQQWCPAATPVNFFKPCLADRFVQCR